MKNLLLLSVAALSLTACKKDDTVDTSKPFILVSDPSDHQEYPQGGTLSITGNILDNENLASYKIEIHEAGGHTHKSANSGQETEWKVEQTKSISGTSYAISERIAIPAEAEKTEYHVIIEALDAAGNAADLIEIEIEVK